MEQRGLTVLPAKTDSDVMFCLQSYQGLKIDRSLVNAGSSIFLNRVTDEAE